MKKVLACVMIGAMLMMFGCEPSAPEVKEAVPVDELEAFAEQLFEYKYEYLTAIQLDADKGAKIVNEMYKSSKIADKLSASDMPKLANVYYNIGSAANEFKKFIETNDAKNFSKGTMYYNDAEVEYKNYKGVE